MGVRYLFPLILCLGSLLLAGCPGPSHVLGNGGDWGQPPDTLWTQAYAGGNWSPGCSLDRTSDGGFIITCQNTDDRLWLIKTDDAGNLLWQTTPSIARLSGGLDVHQTNDGGYVVAGFITWALENGDDVLLIKTDALGNLLWQKTYGGTFADLAASVQQTSDGGYILAGTTDSYGSGLGDVWLIKTDSCGNSVWNHTYGDGSDDNAVCVRQTTDGGFVVAGSTRQGVDQSYCRLLKTNALGQMVWYQYYSGGAIVECWGMHATNDGGFILGANYSVQVGMPGGPSYMILTKVDGNGREEWSCSYRLDKLICGADLELADDGGILVTGKILSAPGNDDLLVMKTNAEGIEVWRLILGGSDNDIGTSIHTAGGGGYLVGGWTQSLAPPDCELWLVRLAGE